MLKVCTEYLKWSNVKGAVGKSSTRGQIEFAC